MKFLLKAADKKHHVYHNIWENEIVILVWCSNPGKIFNSVELIRLLRMKTLFLLLSFFSMILFCMHFFLSIYIYIFKSRVFNYLHWQTSTLVRFSSSFGSSHDCLANSWLRMPILESRILIREGVCGENFQILRDTSRS